MTDKIERILAFIEERIKWNTKMMKHDYKPSDIGRIEEAKCIRRFINSMQEPKQKFNVGDRIRLKGTTAKGDVITNIYKAEDGNTYFEFENSDDALANKDWELVEEPKKCLYSKDNYTEEDRKVLCDGCEDCEYSKKEELVSKVWHDASERPTRLPIIHIWYHGNRVACVRSHENIPLQEDIDDINFQPNDKWAYIDDLLNLTHQVAKKEELVSKVWHEPIERPNSNKVVLIIVRCGYIGVPGMPHLAKYDSHNNQYIDKDRTDVCNRPIMYHVDSVEKWVYIDDILNLTTKEEPVSDDLEKAINFYIENNFFGSETLGFFSNRTKEEPNDQDIALAFKAGANWGKNQTKVEIQAQSMALAHGCHKEPVSEDLPHIRHRDTLNEFAYQCAYDLSNDWAKETPEWKDVKTACKLGAKWQKQHMIDKFNEWCQEKFYVHPHDCHVVQYVSDRSMDDIDDFIEEFETKMKD